MKTVVRYEIRYFNGNEHSKPINYTQRLRTRKSALRLVKKLKAIGHKNIFASPIRISI